MIFRTVVSGIALPISRTIGRTTPRTGTLDPHRVDVGYGRSNDASGQFADQQRGAPERVRRHVGSIRVRSGTTRRYSVRGVWPFADPDRVEIGALDKYFGRRRVRYARVESAEHAGDTSALRRCRSSRSSADSLRSTPSSVTNGVPSGQVLTTILSPLIFAASNACNGCPVSCKMKFVMSTTLFFGLMPIARRRCCNQSGEGAILIPVIVTPMATRRGFGIGYLRRWFSNRCPGERVDRRQDQFVRDVVGLQVDGQVARYAVVRHRVGPVRRQADFEQVIVFQLEIFFRRSSRFHVGRQYDDSFVARSHADLVFGAQHTE